MIKKILSIGLTLALTATTALVPAFAATESPYPDVASDATYASAVIALKDASIMVGDENGNFNPDQTVTRAEMAAIVSRLLGNESQASAITASGYTDVASGHWAAGYVGIASQYGIINGYGNGKFGPSDPVTIQQAAKMLVCSWGHSTEADAAGGYPDGYVAEAVNMSILQSTEGTTAAALRSQIAEMAYACMTNADQRQLTKVDTSLSQESTSDTTTPAQTSSADKAAVTKTLVNGGTYSLINDKSGLALSIHGSDTTSKSDSNMLLGTAAGNPNQCYTITLTDDGWYQLVPQSNTKLYVSANSTHPSNGTNVNVDTAKKNNYDSQGWYFEKVGNYYIIRNAADTNLVLTAQGVATLSRIKIETYQSGNLYQLWSLQ